MNRLDKQYLDLLEDIVANGTIKENRTGTDSASVFGRTIRHKMSDGFPLLTTKRVYFKGVATELSWFLRGRTDLRWLLEHNNHIWVGDAYKNYCFYTAQNTDTWNEWMRDNGDGTLSMYTREEFIDKVKTDDEFSLMWGELGKIYGYQWRHWDVNDGNNNHIDQIETLIEEIKENPDSRRLMVNAWNVAQLDEMRLPPCHYGFQVYTRVLTFQERLQYKQNRYPVDTDDLDTPEKLDSYNIPKRAMSLIWNQRSVDTPLGLPFNIASYGLLLELLCRECNMISDELIGNLGDCHIYVNQLDGVEEQLKREARELPDLFMEVNINLYDFEYEQLTLMDYNPHPAIQFPLSN